MVLAFDSDVLVVVFDLLKILLHHQIGNHHRCCGRRVVINVMLLNHSCAVVVVAIPYLRRGFPQSPDL